MPKRTEVGRIALRVEGEWWNGYWAPRQDSMEGALHLGSVRMGLAAHPKIKEAFINLMTTAFSVAAKEATGLEPTWGDPVEAPENERAGNA
jgi:hypothetical protein